MNRWIGFQLKISISKHEEVSPFISVVLVSGLILPPTQQTAAKVISNWEETNSF